ncbi:hypothetical protein J1N35_044876 [Gossypium stocksii]|uniref:Aminotransferase-like plant mobile domain-containing protein n=1 Tax=Gossypium stocksii TaxID=47602 RepID=A0A9D3UA19_9ROSI|nr:hypothetical protein J1N35_044876 [Gossypium stocksii]
MPDLSRNLVHLRWLLKLVDFRAAGELSWGFAVLATLYLEMCRATVEPFDELCWNTDLSRRYTTSIRPTVGSTNWLRYWSDYIEMWENRYDYIPTREPIIVPELPCVPKYMPWFRIHGKPYLLSEEERRRQIHVQSERRGPLNPRRMDDHAS